MAGTKLIPEKITSPFQLMAAWFVMLVLLTSVLLTAAINIAKPEWAAGYLVVFTSIVIVLALGCVTLMLTVFRPHLQDGKEYAQWLKDKNTYSSGFLRSEQISAGPSLQRNLKKSPTQKIIKNDFLIQVTNLPRSSKLISALSQVGFSAEIYGPESRNQAPEDHESIWVGYALPAKEVIESIKIAVSQWPHLKYMHLSNDDGSPPQEVHRQMYFGGASSTAEERYGLSPWSNDELLNLDENMSQKEFHRVVRSKYP